MCARWNVGRWAGAGAYFAVHADYSPYLLRSICIHNKSHNLHLILGLKCVYTLNGVHVGTHYAHDTTEARAREKQGIPARLGESSDRP